MAAISFRFESVLRYRKQLNDRAMSDYLAAQRDLNQGLARLDQMYKQVDENFKRIQELKEQGGETGESLKTHDEFFAGMQIHIAQQKQKVRELKEVVEEKQGILVQAAKDFKSLEKLKEKQMTAEKKARMKKEQNNLDDLIVMRAARKEEL